MRIDSEKTIEATLKKEVKKMGGWCIKMLGGLISGLPDQLCLLPGGVIFFAELKTTKKRAEKLQKIQHRRLRALGFQVYVIDNLNDLELILNTYRNG